MSSEKELQKIINRIAADSKKAHAIAQKLYGKDAQLFAEAEGTLCVMDGDCDGSAQARQKHVRLSADGMFWCGVGAW